MERITITIETGNAAFEDEPASEVARILRAAADRVEETGEVPHCGLPLFDVNGNRCGAVTIEGGR